VLRETAPDAFRDGHSRLYEYYCKQAPEQPDTLKEMTPLFYAVYHGCQAGRHHDVLGGVYRDRVLRGNEGYLIHKLGASGTNLSLLANFFRSPWTVPVPSLSPADQSWVISTSAFALRALGRLADAVEPMRIGAQARANQGTWVNAATNFGNLSELHLTLGSVKEAIATARQAVDLADRSADEFQRIVARASLADALHQIGSLTESVRLFEEAEHLQAEHQPTKPTLYSHPGYQYGDLLLSQGQTAEVLRHASFGLVIAERNHWLLSIGLDNLSLGRANPPGSVESATHLDQAVDYIRRSGNLDDLPLALLARGTEHDLDEVFRIATRGGMRLHLTDYHLAMARRLKSREHFLKAEALIAETGYHRRDAELESLRPLLES
jgi:tetratricopeptide (TPR) repeat protein